MLSITRKNAPYDYAGAPKIGTIGTVQGLSTINPRRRCIVEAYPLTTSAIWYGRPVSRSCHTVYIRFLDNSQRAEFSARYFEPREL
jgi:hypothetical protein